MKILKKIILASLLVLCCFSQPFAAFASDTLQVELKLDDKPVFANSYSLADLAAIDNSQAYYTSLDVGGTPQFIFTEGCKLLNLLADLGVAQADVNSLRFASGDGWERTYTPDYLFGQTRYSYEDMTTSWSAKAKKFVEGAGVNPKAVQPMLALRSNEKRLASEISWADLSTVDGLRICFGQTKMEEAVSKLYGKHIAKLEINLNSGVAYEIPQKYEQLSSNITANKPNSGEANQEVDASKGNGSESGDEKNQGKVGDLPDSLSIKVGYFGSDYTERKVISLAEMQAMPQVKQAYTFIDSMPAVVVESAVGVRLADILQAAGIDLNSVETLYFYCKDLKSGWYEDLSKAYLLDAKRYFYPNLPTHWDKDLQTSTVGAAMGGVGVDAIIAYNDDWQRFATKADFSDLTATNRFRLVFGQTDTTSPTAFRSAKWIHSIEVLLGGKPPDEANGENQNDKMVGSLFEPKNDGKSLLEIKTDNAGMDEKKPKPAVEAATKTDVGGVQKWRMYEMEDQAVALNQLNIDNPLTPYVLWGFGLIFVLGGCYKFVWYRREIQNQWVHQH